MDLSPGDLRNARMKRKWSQERAAEACGVGVATFQRWEQGRSIPHPANMLQLCKIFGDLSAPELKSAESVHDQQSLVTTPQTDILIMTDHLSSSLRQDLTVRLLKIVWSWSHRDHQPEKLGELQNRINKTVEEYNLIIDQDFDQILTRRNALRSLVLLPIEVCGLTKISQIKASGDDILTQCAAGITAAWHFRKGKELALANDAISIYIPALETMTDVAEKQYKKSAAFLLAQCFLLKATLAPHIENLDQSIQHAKRAIQASEIAGDDILKALILRRMATTQIYANRWTPGWHPGLNSVEQAANLLENQPRGSVPQQIQSYVYAGLALCRAQNHPDQEREVEIALKKAHDTYSPYDKDIPPWIDFRHSILLSCDGLIHHYLGQHNDAIATLSQIPHIHDTSELGKIEAIFDQLTVEILRDDKPRDKDKCVELWKQGVKGAQMLRSEQRFNEARYTYSMMITAWPGESAVKNLRSHLTHW